MVADDELDNFDTFRDCLTTVVIAKLSPAPSKSAKKRSVKGRKNADKQSAGALRDEDDQTTDVDDLSDFVEYLAEELFSNLPDDLRSLSYAVVQDDVATAEKYALPLDTDVLASIIKVLPPTVSDSLSSYALISDPQTSTASSTPSSPPTSPPPHPHPPNTPPPSPPPNPPAARSAAASTYL